MLESSTKLNWLQLKSHVNSTPSNKLNEVYLLSLVMKRRGHIDDFMNPFTKITNTRCSINPLFPITKQHVRRKFAQNGEQKIATIEELILNNTVFENPILSRTMSCRSCLSHSLSHRYYSAFDYANGQWSLSKFNVYSLHTLLYITRTLYTLRLQHSNEPLQMMRICAK